MLVCTLEFDAFFFDFIADNNFLKLENIVLRNPEDGLQGSRMEYDMEGEK